MGIKKKQKNTKTIPAITGQCENKILLVQHFTPNMHTTINLLFATWFYNVNFSFQIRKRCKAKRCFTSPSFECGKI